MGADHDPWPAKRFRMTTGRRIGTAVMTPLIRWGLVPRTGILTTVGRRSGERRDVPVTWSRVGGRLFLVAPYGPVGWVWNLRASGRATLTGRTVGGEYATREVSAREAAPVLRDYLRFASATRPYFVATKDAPVEAFEAEAHTHPVFELTPLAGG